MGVLIASTTAAKESDPFEVQPGTFRGIVAKGLAGAERVILQVRLSDGTWQDTATALTATDTTATIQAQSLGSSYRVRKEATAGAAFVDMV